MTRLRFEASFLARTGRIAESWNVVGQMMAALALGARPEVRA